MPIGNVYIYHICMNVYVWTFFVTAIIQQRLNRFDFCFLKNKSFYLMFYIFKFFCNQWSCFQENFV